MIALLTALAAASPCEEGGLAEGPVAVGLLDGQLGAAHRLCPRTELGLGGGAFLLDDTVNNNIYGQILLQGVVDGSVALSEDTALLARVEAFRQHQVISLVGSTYTGLGHTTLGASHVLLRDDDLVVGGIARVVLPTAFGLYHNQWPLGADLGAGLTWAPTGALRVHGQLSLLGSIGLGRGPTQPRGAIAPTVGAELRPGKAFALAVDLAASFGYEAGLDWFAPQIALRFAPTERLGIAIEAMLPMVGPTPRPLASAALRATWRFE